MDSSKELEVKKYIDEKERTGWLSGLFEVTADLVWIEKETKEWILSNWLKNDENLLEYAKLVTKTEKLTARESIRYRLLELKLSIVCPYFADFKDFLEELKLWSDTSMENTTDTASTTAASTENTPESSETSANKFCWTSVNKIKSEPFERNSSTWVTWCSKTARNNWKNFWIILPSWNAYDAWQLPWKNCLTTIPSDKKDERPTNKRKWIESEKFNSVWKWNYADIYTDSKSAKYWHRAAAFRDDSWQWYVLDPYTRVNWKLDNSPKKLEDYLKFRKIVKAHIYESKWYVWETVEAMDGSVERAVQWAINIAEDNCYWYEWWWRWKNDRGKWWYDCASLVCTAFKNAWFNIPITWCGPMQQNFEKEWFEWISPYDVNNLQRWDILLDKDKHTELYIWNGRTVWAHSDKDGKDWDSGWNEISETDGKYFLYQYHKEYGRDWVLRYKWKK